MKQVIIIAGPNGAGKTSFSNQYLPAAQDGLVFVNADEIARDMALAPLAGSAASIDFRAGRNMLDLIDDLAADGRDFMFETTLATRICATKVPVWQRLGYSVALIYLPPRYSEWVTTAERA